MSDRLALANAIEDAGIERSKAERVASVIFDAIHDNVATKADVQQMETALKADIARTEAALKAEIVGVRSVIASETARLDTRIERLDAKVGLVEHRLLTRLGGLVVVIAGLLFGALHYWPPH
jgi:hypothetical protein